MKKKEIKFIHALLPVLFLFLIMAYGLCIRPFLLKQQALPIEMLMLFASMFTIIELLFLGYTWNEVLDNILKKLNKALAAWFIMLSIGVLIGSWIISGTIPMMIYYGIKIINPKFIYLIALIIPIIFSTFTGTSWGAVGTIGVVILGIATTIEANLPIIAGAIIGGAYFGDKMSPLSDTTNMSALAADVDLYDHVKSMMYTTIPATIIGIVFYTILGFIYPPKIVTIDAQEITITLNMLNKLFNFNILLLIPVVIVLYGSIKKKPTVPVLIISSVVASILALIFQRYSFGDIVSTLNTGYKVSMASWIETEIPQNIITILERGGLYTLSGAVIIAWMIFIYIGAIDTINAMPIVVEKLFGFAKTRFTVILSSIVSSVIMIAVTANGYATSFIVADTFKSKYDKLNISRKVLSRTLEDGGTFFDPIFPWTPAAIFMAMTLGIPTIEYVPWCIVNLSCIVIAIIIAYFNIGCFKNETNEKNKNIN